MPPTKIRGILDEIPWIKKHITGPITHIYVSKIETKFLNHSPFEKWEFAPGGGIWSSLERMLMLNENGDLITAEKEEVTYPREWWCLFRKSKTPLKTTRTIDKVEHTIAGTLRDFGDKADRARFILSYFYIGPPMEPQQVGTVIVYKIPDSMSLQKWIELQIEAEKIDVKKAFADIDQEGQNLLIKI